VHDVDGVANHGRDARRELVEVLLGDLRGAHRRAVVDLGQDEVLLVQHDVELLTKDFGVEQVLDPQAYARGLVGVGRTDPALGGAQGVLAQEALGESIEFLMVGHDQVRITRDDQPRHVDVLGRQIVELGQ